MWKESCLSIGMSGFVLPLLRPRKGFLKIECLLKKTKPLVESGLSETKQPVQSLNLEALHVSSLLYVCAT